MRVIRRSLGVLKGLFDLLLETLMDSSRFFKASATSSGYFNNEKTHLESDIVRLYHVIEKSLCMPDFKPGSAKAMVMRLHQCLMGWKGPANTQTAAAWKVLAEYHSRHAALDFALSVVFPDGFKSPSAPCDDASGGVKPYTMPSTGDRETFTSVVSARSSVRHFDLDKIPTPELLKRSVEIAMTSPSVCNRQTWRAHCYKGDSAQELLKLQNGNRGFGHTIPVVFVVTSDLRWFTGVSERNQAWIDGGMFAMTLLLGLHAQGLGAVALNWSVLNKRDRELRKLASIPQHERIIMLIGCGYPVDGATVPVSTRRSVDEVFISHDH